MLTLAGPAAAQTGSTADEWKIGSVYLRCDGFPAHRSGAELAGRLILIMATAGLAGPGEKADTGKRLSGADGVAACTDALARETDPIRRVQLQLARSIHHIEAKEFEAALSDARGAPGLAGDKVNDLGFRHSLMLSALELEAAALVRLNRPAEAEAAALKMAALSPYDVTAQQRATLYLGLTGEMTPAKKEYLDRLSRLLPKGLATKAGADEWSGDYKAAAADIEAYLELKGGFFPDKSVLSPEVALRAREAAALALSGDMTQSEAVAADTRKSIDDLVASGKALNEQNIITEAQELLDFQAIVARLNAGHAAEARAAFAARSRWLVPTPAAVADLAAKLRKGAPAGELAGALAKDPASLRASALAARVGAITQATDADKNLYAAIRFPMTAGDYDHWDSDVWDVARSPFLPKKTGKETYAGDFILMRGVNGIATGDALLMHAALLADSRGDKEFVLLPVRERLDSTIVRFGNPGDPGFPASAANDAATVIAALSVEFPNPHMPKPDR